MVSDIRVVDCETFLVRTVCRTPLKFGAVVVDELPAAYAKVTAENRAGQVGVGWGAMFLMDLWAWPMSAASHQAKSAAMCDLLDRCGALARTFEAQAHPLSMFADIEAELPRLARSACDRYTPGEVMPFLAALVCASPVDHAIHDAFGVANGFDSYLGYGPSCMGFDLSRLGGPRLRGVYPAQFLRQAYLPEMPVFHLVGGLDNLRREEVPDDAPNDGLPNSLDDWIARDGVYCLKVKLRGRDLEWDVARTLEVSRVYHETQRSVRHDLPEQPSLTVDTNEQCESPWYVIEYFNRLKNADPAVFAEVLYIEQPTERDLAAHGWDMRDVARIRPVLVDESLTSVGDFHLAMQLGWSGIALKSCKCLSADLVLVAVAELAGVPYAVQDLTNPSLALLASLGLAGRTHTIKGVEANSRQFFPRANDPIREVHSHICEIRDGHARLASLRGPGLGFRVPELTGFEDWVRREDAEFRRKASGSGSMSSPCDGR